ncbi:beta-1,4-N-acetyl- mannosaminyltransferase [Fibrobacter sp. UWB4]|uniref:WecB/TagA/CpsF family glycosyltransferase n=1 Tax=Fibrobacter sp. UWB4 TaxID=1964356 RepID=UPI000B5257BD|nr:WecB/TagA/CpsF family glycosyltransferase [Fibrobacter sp. UWB4]MBO4828753.1 WecB/TagA/CpsF family glycosyltransferase [Fibrobacter sp.]OWV20194.1 beta-1,4-N-acetyl- mannosaminyltransferase [Fibrobacter sp. UWB4]
MICIRNLNLLCSRAELANLPEGKLLINTINAFSYNNARRDVLFEEALTKGDVLIPDGISIVRVCKFLNGKSRPKERIAGWDLFVHEMQRLNEKGGKVMFLGSSEKVLKLIRQKAAIVYPNLEVVTYSPPYKPQFTVEDDLNMVKAINDANPDLLWIGMTAPKQEKWAYANWDRLNIHCHVGTVGAVFDFFAGTYKRAPMIWQRLGLEWLYRLLKEPRRMWRRYIIGNLMFCVLVFREKLGF